MALLETDDVAEIAAHFFSASMTAVASEYTLGHLLRAPCYPLSAVLYQSAQVRVFRQTRFPWRDAMCAQASLCRFTSKSCARPKSLLAFILVLSCNCFLKYAGSNVQRSARFHLRHRGLQPLLPWSARTRSRRKSLRHRLPRWRENNLGTFFKMTPGRAITILYHFDTAHGANPYGGVTLGLDGNLYGATKAGGTNNFGTVFRITPAGVLTVLHNFNNSDGANPYGPPLQASNGNFYGLTSHGTAYRITSSGAFTLLKSGMGTAYRSTAPGLRRKSLRNDV